MNARQTNTTLLYESDMIAASGGKSLMQDYRLWQR
jgi:hypothetical protein